MKGLSVSTLWQGTPPDDRSRIHALRARRRWDQPMRPPGWLPSGGLWRALAISAFAGSAGCHCKGAVLSRTTYGGGTVSITLSSLDQSSGVAGGGTALGWDPDVPAGEPEPGGDFIESTEVDTLSGASLGTVCVDLDRTDRTECNATSSCVQWVVWPPATDPHVYPELGVPTIREADVDTTTPGADYQPASSFEVTSVASGSFTVEDVPWEDTACGVSTISVEWAFDEEAPIEQYANTFCG